MIPARSILLLFLAFLALAGPVRAQAGLFIVHLTIGPAWVADRAAQDQAGFGEHSQNLARLRRQGSLLVGARYQDQVADKGMLIIRAANRDEISAMFASDPMVRDRMFVLDIASLRPFLDGYVGRPAPAAASADAASLDGLNWLAGCWFGRNGKFEFREHWMRAAGGVMLGMGRTLMDGKLASFESMRIALDESGRPVFTPKPSGKPEASFRMIRQGEGSIVFENPEKDFPQRVLYRLDPQGALQARIEGVANGTERGIDFPMQRAACD